MQEDKFSLFIPVDTIEKGKDKDGKEIMIIGGAVSNEQVGPDLDGEIIEIDGMDLSRFMKSGYVNYNHLASKDPSMIIGEPISFEKKDGKLYVKSQLYAESEMAQKVYGLAKTLAKSSSSRKLCYSIEGTATLRDEKNPKRIKKSAMSGLAVTPSPKNGGTEVLLVKGEVVFENQIDSDFLIDITENGIRTTVDKNLTIEKSNPTDSGGMHTQVGETAEQKDRVTTKESLEGTKKKKKRKEAGYLTKGELISELIFDYNLDEISCKRVYDLCVEIDKNILKKNI